MPKTKKILLVDDEPIVRKVCEIVLRSRGFDPITRAGGIEGLETYRERHEEICLVLSDIYMPVMNGIEMSRKIFGMNSHANVILMSADSFRDIVPDEIGRLCSIIDKPFTAARLLEAVQKRLSLVA